MLDHAIEYAKQGYKVFPLIPRGKTPKTVNGHHAATTNLTLINRWWKRNPNFNIGIATGGAFFVVDVDADHDGEASIAKLERKHGALPETTEVITGAGRHLWFASPEDQVIRNSVGTKSGAFGLGIDVRGRGGFVVAPPSIHPTGRRYTFSVDSGTLSPAPDWLVKAAAWPRGEGVKGKSPEQWHEAMTADIPEGARNDTLTSIAGKLLFCGLDMMLTYDLVGAVNIARCKPPIGDDEVRALIASIVKTDLRKTYSL